MLEKKLIDYCKRVDDVLSYWVNERMKSYSGKQYGKQIIEDLMNENPIKTKERLVVNMERIEKKPIKKETNNAV